MQGTENIWNILHDGGIVAARGDVPGDLTFVVEIEYLTELMIPPESNLEVTLLGCSDLLYRSWKDDSETSDVASVVAQEPEILSGTVDADGVSVICADGELRLRYSDVRVQRPGGTKVPIAELIDVASRYWEAFRARQGT